ncbi:MAG TPA: aldehyde dehydrogenase family protein, partial [Arthrobacter sp.]|nr:aldehyde dehydrogenase family protein [Arthrobacter sp.]
MTATTNTASSTKTSYRVLNPATGEVVEEFPTATDADIQDALAAAQEAFQSWKDVPIT